MHSMALTPSQMAALYAMQPNRSQAPPPPVAQSNSKITPGEKLIFHTQHAQLTQTSTADPGMTEWKLKLKQKKISLTL